MTDATETSFERRERWTLWRPKDRAPRRFWNLTGTISFGVVVAVVSAVALVGFVATLASERSAREQFVRSSDSISALMVEGLGGAVRFKKSELIESKFGAFLDSNRDQVSFIAAYAKDGAPIAAIGTVDGSLDALVRQAIETGERGLGSDGFARIEPVRFGKKDKVVGALVVGWTDASLRAIITDKRVSLGLLGAGTAIVFGFVAILLLQILLARPLNSLFGSMRRLSAGESAEIDGVGRADEIGALAREMTKIYAKAVEAAQIRSALDSSSACVLVTDPNNKAVYLSGALKRLLAGAGLSFTEGEPADTLLPRLIAAELTALSGSVTRSAEIGSLRLELVLSPITNADGEMLGAVTQWRDLTEELRLRDQIDALVAGVGEGDFSRRVHVAPGADGLGLVATNLNEISAQVEAFLDEIERGAQALAAGDLSYRIASSHRGRFGDVTNHLRAAFGSLSDLIAKIKTSEARIEKTLVELESGSRNLSTRAESQATSIEQTAASMEEMAESVACNAKGARDANDVAAHARLRAERGQSVVGEAVEAMVEIEGGSEKIKAIISVIDGIAFQTNLLALNAAVEAARAGEAGKGFAVVAAEVRTLAQNASEAARDISALITVSAEKVDGGVELVRATGAALGEVVEAIENVTAMVGAIAVSSGQQSEGVSGVNAALAEMDGITQANATLAVETASSARRLGEEATLLRSLIDSFKLGDPAESDAQHAA